jgi:hypothetical protein
MTRQLFGLDDGILPPTLWLVPAWTPYRDNPPLTVRTDILNHEVQARLSGWIRTPWFAGWIYVVAAVLATAIGAARLGLSSTALWLSLSALGYAAPLAVISGSAEFRYLSWLVLGSLLALAAALFERPEAKRSP